MKIAYIAGPYRAGHGRTVEDNISEAAAVAVRYWKKGYAVFCPHMNSSNLDGIVPDEQFLKAGLRILARCDVLVAMRNWAESVGATAEVELADSLEMLVIYDGLEEDKKKQ